MARYEFEFPLPVKPWSTNEDRNLSWPMRYEKIQTWKEAAFYTFKQHATNGAIPKTLPHGVVQVSIPFRDKRARDPHNYCGTVVKAIIDGLVLAGAWEDDTPDYVGHREPVLVKGKTVTVTIDCE